MDFPIRSFKTPTILRRAAVTRSKRGLGPDETHIVT